MKITSVLVLVILSIFSCYGQNNQLSPENIANNACECFKKQLVGSIDEKLTPCLSKPINDNQHQIYDGFYSDLSLEDAITMHMMKSVVYMVHNCDPFYQELDLMFTNMYPETAYEQVKEEVDSLTKLIEGRAEIDSVKLDLIHQQIAMLTKARKLDEALKEIESLSKNFPASETYFIKMYIFRLQGKYDLALQEIDAAVKEGQTNYMLFAELIKRNKNDR